MTKTNLESTPIGSILAVIVMAIAIGICALLFVVHPGLNPFTPRGQVIGIFVEGYHEGFGDFCGDYPNSGIRFNNSYYDSEHFPFDRNGWFYFGNQYKRIDDMIEGVQYRVWYYEDSRQSDTTSGDVCHFWVIYDIESLGGR